MRYSAHFGHELYATTGLVYMRARYYEAETGRFISEDPARDGGNWYVYAKNSPTTQADPSGKVAQAVIIAAYIFASGVINMLFTCVLSNDWSLKTMVRGFSLGAATAAGTLGGPLDGALVGGLMGMVDAYLSGGSVAAGGFFGAFGGGLGGVLGVQAAVAERQLVLYALLSFDVGAMSADGSAYGGLLE